MLQRLRQISISSSLRGAFLTGALLTLIVSSVSLYSWHEQSSQIRYSLDEYFPRIHAAFLIEGNLNLVVDQLNEFLLAPNTTVRLQLRNQIIQHLDKIERLSQGLSPAERQQLGVILQDSRALLAELDRVLYNMFLVREKVGELAARIDWLHDDFTTELNSLVQDFTWQQGTLLDQIEARQGDARQYLKRAREVQNEQQQVYTLARIENQIVDDLRDRLNELKSGNDDGMLVETHIRYLENLKKTADENIRALDDWPSTITLRQTIDELLEIGMVKNNMPDTMRDYVSAQFLVNDLVFDNQGGFYFTDSRGNSADPQGGVFYVSPNVGSIHAILPGLAVGNGIAIDPAGSQIWATEHAKNRLHRVRLSDATTVAPFGSVVTYQFTGPAPDGARVDSEGNVYVAISGQGRVMVFNRNGLPIGQIVLPDRDKGRNLKSTSLAIRPGHRELFIVANSGTEPGGAMIFRSGAFAPAPFPFSHQ